MGRVVIKKAGGGLSFSLKAGNGEVVGVSERYSAEAACRSGIESVRRNADAPVEDQTVPGAMALSHPKYEVYLDKKGEFRFRLKARNGEIILASEGYSTKNSCLNGIKSVAKNAPEAKVTLEA